MTTSSAAVIPALSPASLNLAGVPLTDALWLHGRGRGDMTFTQALATERGARVLATVRMHGLP